MLSCQDFVVSMLQEEGLVDATALEKAASRAAEHGTTVTEALVAAGFVSARDMAMVHAAVCECPYADLDHYDVDLRNAALLPRSVAESCLAFPLFNFGPTVTVAMADPLDLRSLDQVRGLLKADVDPVLCEPGALRSLIERAYSMTAGRGDAPASPATDAPADAGRAGDDEPIVAAVNQIIAHAIEEGASDVHIGPDDRELHLRYRIDGVLQARQGPPLSSHAGLVQRLKVMANLDLTQTRRPQDGKFRFTHAGRQVDVRLSLIPTVCGENVVMRLLANNVAIKGFSELGLAPDLLEKFERALEHPHGMILVTGPTGSGKSTTLYTAIKKLNTPDRNVITIEDPVEIRLPLVRQVQVNAEIGMTFAGVLRSILRQDPDVILVGEIRDQETARIAVQAALTGHLVLATLHTNDAPASVARLQDLGCPGFAINAALLCVIGQRLVKTNCTRCAAPYEPEPALLARFGMSPGTTLTRGNGCPRCMNAGFRGRMGVYEMLTMTSAVQAAVERGESSAALRALAVKEGMRPLWRDGLEKAKLGLTTLEEVVRIAAGAMAPEAVDGDGAEARRSEPSPMRISA